MLLALDVGNTNIAVAVYRGSGEQAELAGCWRLRTDPERTSDEHGATLLALLSHSGIAAAEIDGVAISSVAPTLHDTLEELSQRYFRCNPLFVGAGTDAGIAIRYHPPSDVGADRICNAVGAFARYGGPAIVVDFGTATTLDAIGRNGDYLGGAILPGIGISMAALYSRAARLFRVEAAAPPRAIADNTVAAIQSGMVYGFAGQADAMVERFREELGGSAHVIATGGLAELIAAHSRAIQHVDSLVTLDGLRRIFERHRPGK